MRFEEYRKHDAISLAELIAKREVSVEEVLETAIARAEQVNPAINAIVHKQYEQARKAVAAGLPDGPLKGVPYLIEDLGFLQTGEPATLGSTLFKDFVADHDTTYVTRCFRHMVIEVRFGIGHGRGHGADVRAETRVRDGLCAGGSRIRTSVPSITRARWC